MAASYSSQSLKFRIHLFTGRDPARTIEFSIMPGTARLSCWYNDIQIFFSLHSLAQQVPILSYTQQILIKSYKYTVLLIKI